MGNELDSSNPNSRSLSMTQMDMSKTCSSGDRKLSITQRYRQMRGCFIIKVKKLHISQNKIDYLLEKHPDLKLGELQLMLSYKGQQFILQTLKKDFNELNKISKDSDNESQRSYSVESYASFCKQKSRPKKRQSFEQNPLNVDLRDQLKKFSSKDSILTCEPEETKSKLTYDIINQHSDLTQSQTQALSGDVFQINCRDLQVGEEFSYQLAALKIIEQNSDDVKEADDDLPLFETLILAEKKIKVHDLIYNNMQSMSISLREQDLTTNPRIQDIKTEKASKQKKIGDLKFKISFMREKFFQESELSKVLLTESERQRRMKKVEVDSACFQKSQSMVQMENDQNLPFQINCFSSNTQMEQNYDDNYLSKKFSEEQETPDIQTNLPQEKNRKLSKHVSKSQCVKMSAQSQFYAQQLATENDLQDASDSDCKSQSGDDFDTNMFGSNQNNLIEVAVSETVCSINKEEELQPLNKQKTEVTNRPDRNFWTTFDSNNEMNHTFSASYQSVRKATLQMLPYSHKF